MLEEEEHELAPPAVEEEVAEEEEDEDDGPPPGFQHIIIPQPTAEVKAAEAEAEVDAVTEAANNDDEEDGPPPGFDCITPKPLQSLPSSVSSDTTSSKQDDMDDDVDGPPPGWEFSNLVNALPKETSSTEVGHKRSDGFTCFTLDISDIKEEGNEELDEGPPPGWESVLPCQMPQPDTPPLHLPSTVSPNSEMGSEQIIPKNDNEVPQSESEDTPMLGSSPPATPPPPQLPSSEQPSDAGIKDKEDKKTEEKRSTAWDQPASPLRQLPSNPHPLSPVPKSPASEKAQLVCGTCRKLCLYLQGAKWIRCPGCQEVNFVLEAHEIGQVNCGGCEVLLMYPHGAPAVQCSSCRIVTEIGAHNKRPPLSVQHAQARDQRRQRCSTQAR